VKNWNFRIVAAVIASGEDTDGNPLYSQKWDANKLDLPLVETSKQRRPSITAETMGLNFGSHLVGRKRECWDSEPEHSSQRINWRERNSSFSDTGTL
jgi:hypothetical protein